MKKIINKLKLSDNQRIIISSLLIVVINILKYTIGEDELVSKIIMIISTLFVGWPIFVKAFSSLKYKIVGIDALVTIATFGAIIIQENYEAAMVTFLFMFGEYLEARTIEKTRSSIRSLLDLRPLVAKVIKEEGEVELSVDDVIKGDKVIVRPGEKIAIDGKIIKGESYVNEAAITGESIPLLKSVDDYVYSGSVIESGYLVIEAEKVGEDTTFNRILNMVEEAQDKKAKTQKFIEKIARFYTPLIILISIIFFALTQNVYIALTFLVIGCPGALVISTPISIVAGIGNGAKKGVLFKGGEVIEGLSKVDVVAFDKTGTLTIGKPVVNKIIAFDYSQEEVLRIAAIGETYSEHPLALAIINEYKKTDQNIEHPSDAKVITGKGIEFKYQDVTYQLGSRSLFDEISHEIEEALVQEEMKAQTMVIVANEKKIIGAIAISDQIRENVPILIKRLRKLGIKKLYMLTGDNELTAKAIAKEIDLDGYYAKLLPEDKVRIIGELKNAHGKVLMVGDGVNDAPALAASDLSIAVGGKGKDIAMETADAVLLSEDISKLSYSIALSKATTRNIAQNITFAMLITLTLLFGVLFDWIHLPQGMLIHETSVLLVIINAARLLRFKNK